MKVLFAVSNESISEAIVKKYQKDYKEIISYKNVYYFNAILKEIQRDKTYDRIVISEDLEPFANNDYEAIDKFIFDKLDSISDEAIDIDGGDTPIILICSDRRAKSEQLLVKLFGIGVYSALLGQDRSIEEVCKLIKKPRTKKEAKIYYKVESEDVNYQSENEDSVSEVEIQNIRNHYKKLGKNEDKYVDSFNNIASQYTDAQLRVIIKFLPLNVRAVLETESPKYQSIISFSGTSYKKETKKQVAKKEDSLKIDFIENQLNKPKLTKPVVVPSAVDTSNVKKLNKKVEPEENIIQETQNLQNILDDLLEEEPKRKRGRPRKIVQETPETQETVKDTPKRGRGRPRKNAEIVQNVEEKTIPNNDTSVNLFGLDDEEDDDNTLNTLNDTILPGFEENDVVNNNNISQFEENDIVHNNNVVSQFEEDDEEDDKYAFSNINNSYVEKNNNSFNQNSYTNYDNYNNSNEIVNQESNYQSVNIENLLTRDKKIVSFVGTPKNGTSFLINNLAELFSSMGINTAILDATKNKNSYYIYTKNEEALRNIAFNCMSNLSKGIPEGIKVNKSLTVYTSLPKEEDSKNYEAILSTLVKNYSLVLIDCDFYSPFEYFENSQEIYLVQSMDILTIQPLTAFLRDLKAKNILLQEKLRIIINKEARIRSLGPKVIIGGMAFYNDPAMSFMTELFNKDNIKYCTIPFDMQVYSKYLEGLVNCRISLNGYPKNFINPLKELGNMVYPLLSNKYRPVETYERRDTFSKSMNNTLEQMKNKF